MPGIARRMSPADRLHPCAHCFSVRASSEEDTDSSAVLAFRPAPWRNSSRKVTRASRGRARPRGATSVASTAGLWPDPALDSWLAAVAGSSYRHGGTGRAGGQRSADLYQTASISV